MSVRQPLFSLVAAIRRTQRKVFGMSANCLFCRIVKREIPAKILYEDEKCIAFHDISPQGPVHFLVIPRKHIPTLTDLAPEDAALAGELLIKAGELAKQTGISEKGFRVVNNIRENGGQTVFHLHFHVIGGRSLQWPPG